MSLLTIRDLVVRYRGVSGAAVEAVAGASLDVDAGQIVALVGESGCGKSSLGKAAVGLVSPFAGEVRFQGVRVAPLGQGARPIGQRSLQMVFQDPFSSLNPRRTVGALIADGLRVSRTDEGRAVTVSESLEQVGLSAAMADRFPHQFSGGQRQRIAIARALAAQPRCLVADEPISALDASAQAAIANLLVSLVAKLKLALLFISHDLSIVRRIADVTAVMYLGKIVEIAPSAALWRTPCHPYTAGLIAAVPEPDGLGRLPVDLPGDVPDPAHPPSGCRFHPRCPRAIPLCTSVEPEFRQLNPDRWAACHLAEAGPD